ncbi:MAG TPA: hypothetical protein VGQ33_21985, partial [Vicinamibacteria bacterium]|nr:hypothetical protein [Vicinamibacteria bacterium]
MTLVLARAAAAEETHLVIVVGLGGEPKYTESFDALAVTMIQAAEKKYGVPATRIRYLGEKPAEPAVPAYLGPSTRENVEKALGAVTAEARPGDLVFILLIGHGSFQSGESRFSLPGPDMTASDFAPLLARLSAQQVVFVDTASASGDWIKPLSSKGRTIVAATKSGQERNETEFPRYFVEAFAGDKADADKDERVSVLEAFTYARREVERFYETGHRLLTEHAVLDEGGSGEGALARTLFLGGDRGESAAEAASADPQRADLQRQRREVEQKIALLKSRKDQMPADQYEDALETLLVELA